MRVKCNGCNLYVYRCDIRLDEDYGNLCVDCCDAKADEKLRMWYEIQEVEYEMRSRRELD